MENTREKLREIDAILKEHDAPLLNYFNPGLPHETIADLFLKHGLFLNSSLAELYEWHNGIDFTTVSVRQSLLEIMPMGIFYSMQQMMEARQDLLRWNYMENSAAYFPLFGSGEDDLYLLKNDTGEIFFLSPAVQIYGALEFTSIDSMLDCLIECYKQGVLRIAPDEGLIVEDDEFEKMKEKYRRS